MMKMAEGQERLDHWRTTFWQDSRQMKVCPSFAQAFAIKLGFVNKKDLLIKRNRKFNKILNATKDDRVRMQ
jgi:hypothetical protein